MTIQQLKLKQIPICQILNIQADKKEFFICSPFRNEKTPSFKINTQKNIWYDHGSGEGGTNIDLIMKLKNCDTKTAIAYLKQSNNDFSFHLPINPQISQIEDEKPKIRKIQILQNQALTDYLKSRKINIDVAKQYLSEIYYTQKQKNYFAISFKNDKNGYEVRNPYFKGCIGHKSITTIKTQNSKVVSIFEGFMDFLSAITHYQKTPANNVIILNSLSMLKNLDLSDYAKICLYLDNDKAGKDAVNKLKSKYNNIIDFSNIYKNYKDFNDFLNKK